MGACGLTLQQCGSRHSADIRGGPYYLASAPSRRLAVFPHVAHALLSYGVQGSRANSHSR
eukprot:3476935-Amphidinium_carterae.1